MKAYTDKEQSKKLEEILPIESADMFLAINGTFPVMSKYIDDGFVTGDDTAIPCWSLAALLGVLPKKIGRHTKTLYWFDDAWHCEYVDEDSEGKYGVTTDNPVDACVEKIEKIHVLNLL